MIQLIFRKDAKIYDYPLYNCAERDVWIIGYNIRADKWENEYVPEAIQGLIDYVGKIRKI